MTEIGYLGKLTNLVRFLFFGTTVHLLLPLILVNMRSFFERDIIRNFLYAQAGGQNRKQKRKRKRWD